MKHPTFFNGVVLALLLALGGTAAHFVLGTSFSGVDSLKLLIVLLSGCYVLYLLIRSNERTGRVFVATTWLLASVSAWLWAPSVTLVILVQGGLLWLIRSLYYRTSMLPAVLDLGLVAGGITAAIATANHSHSIFLSIWTFFLVQSLFVILPVWPNARRKKEPNEPDHQFNRALRTAEAAVRRMHTNH